MICFNINRKLKEFSVRKVLGAPSLDIVPALIEAGAKVRVYDPESMHEAKPLLEGAFFCDGPYHALENADAVAIVTEWDQFRALDLDRIKDMLNEPVVVDLRNIYPPDVMRDKGFNYVSIGRG